MKATFFQQSLEYKLEVSGEQWTQGQALQGQLIIKNHQSHEVSLEGVGLYWALGNLKKVKGKAADAFQDMQSVSVGSQKTLDKSQATSPIPWELTLPLNGPITDNSQSPYLILKNGQGEIIGHLQLQVQPHAVFEDFAQILVLNDRFVIKHRKNQKRQVEYKLAPPGGKKFSSIDHILLRFQIGSEDQDLKVAYEITTKEIDSDGNGMKVKKVKKKINQCLSSSDYRAFNGRLKPEKPQALIEETVGNYRERFI